MGSSAKDLYETDFVAWSERNAELLREGRFEDADLAHIIEEIEDLGGNWQRALDSHTYRLLAHLLKWEYQPEYPGRGGWKNTITAQRIEAHKLLRRAPSLKNYFRENLAENYADAVRLAASETGLPRTAFPSTCPYTVEKILDDEFLPGA